MCKIMASARYRVDNEKKQTTRIFVLCSLKFPLHPVTNSVINTQVDVCQLFPGVFLRNFTIVIFKTA